jgi:hypothetical protein
MMQALPHAVTPGPAGPDLAAADVARGQRALRQRRRRRLAGVAGTVAVGAAAAVLTATSAPWSAGPGAASAAPAGGTRPAGAGASAGTAGAKSPLIVLAADVAALPQPAGNATLVERETGTPGHATINVWDLYADNGQYFFSQTKAGLPAQVREDHSQGGGQFGREVAAATYAVTGNLDTAALKMAWPYPTPVPAWLSAQVKTMSKATGEQIDNYVWENSEDALVAGSGNPQVRAGVLRLVSALPGITVTKGTVDGQPTLTLTAGAPELGRTGVDKADPKIETGPAYEEAITINATTGIPLGVASGPAGKVVPAVTYQVTRVNLADIASGKF